MITAKCKWPGARIATMLFCVGLLLVGAFAVQSSAHARSLDDKEKLALAATVVEFKAVLNEKKYDSILNYMPPRMLEAIAKGAKTTADNIRLMVAKTMRDVFTKVKMESFSMTMAKATYKVLPNGEPYVLIPTRTVMIVPGKKLIKTEQTIAMRDNGKWYLLRISNLKQLAQLQKVYPAFDGVTMPSGSMQVIKTKDPAQTKNTKDTNGSKGAKSTETKQ